MTTSTGVVDATTLDRKVLWGYQGWHRMPADSSPTPTAQNWFMNAGTAPAAASTRPTTLPTAPVFDQWPDMAEYPTRYDTGYDLPDGSPAYLYSSWDASAVAVHFRWMRDYGIDGAVIQRFGKAVTNPNLLTVRNRVTDNCLAAADTYGRSALIMYDLSGLPASGLAAAIISDWKTQVVDRGVTASPRYQRHTGRGGVNAPVVQLWGFTFSAGNGTAADLTTLIDFFHGIGVAGPDADPRYRATVMCGINAGWRTGGFATALGAADILSPWTVGRYTASSATDVTAMNRWIAGNIAADLSYMTTIMPAAAYAPVIFPGASDYNRETSNNRPNTGEFNNARRWGGTFLWNQATAMLSALSSAGFPPMLWGAMFDEVNEGTAILKYTTSAAQVPAISGAQWIHAAGTEESYRMLPGDWYLRQAGAVGSLCRGEMPLAAAIPLPPQ